MSEAAAVIVREVCEAFGVSESAVYSGRRNAQVAEARHVAQLVLRQRLNMSYEAIARHFGQASHTTVMSACQAVRTDAACFPRCKARYEAVGVQL